MNEFVSINQPESVESPRLQFDNPTMIFCIGPVKDIGLVYPSLNLATAAKILYEMNATDGFIALGGPSGGDKLPTEAELMKKRLQGLGLPHENITAEEGSLETIENLVNGLNMIDTKDSDPSQFTPNILTATHHMGRTNMLAKLFAIPVKDRFTAEAVLQYGAINGYADEIYDELNGTLAPDVKKGQHMNASTHVQNMLDGMIDVNDQTTFYGTPEAGGMPKHRVRMFGEMKWNEEMLNLPERILPYAANLINDRRVVEIVNICKKLYGPKMDIYGFEETDNPDQLRAKMKKVEWPYPTGRTTKALEDKRGGDLNDQINHYLKHGFGPEYYAKIQTLMDHQLYQS